MEVHEDRLGVREPVEQWAIVSDGIVDHGGHLLVRGVVKTLGQPVEDRAVVADLTSNDLRVDISEVNGLREPVGLCHLAIVACRYPFFFSTPAMNLAASTTNRCLAPRPIPA